MYQESIVTFIDILGFGDLVKNSEDNTDRINEVLGETQKSFSPVSWTEEGEEEVNRDNQPKVLSFSDSIVRVRNIKTEANKKHPTGLLFAELSDLVWAQYELIHLGIIIRGGVSIGDIYISSGRVFGPGLIRAHELENKYALYPRIIIDPILIIKYKNEKLLKAGWHKIEEELKFFEDLIKQGDDGVWFVDYAREIGGLIAPQEYLAFLQKHREVIIEGAKKNKNHMELNSISIKFIWMANYHNHIISNLDDAACESCNLDKNEYIITSQELPALQYLRL